MFETVRKWRAIAMLRDKLAQIDRRRAEIEARLPQAGEYQHQELLTEDRELVAVRRHTDLELRGMTEKPTLEDKERLDEAARRRQRAIDQYVREQSEIHDIAAARFEAQGDYRNARYWRRQKLDLRQHAEQIIH